MNSTTRTVDSNGYFIESKAIASPTVVHKPVDIKQEKRRKAIINACMRHRAKRAKPYKLSHKAIEQLIQGANKHKADNTTTGMNHAQFMTYLDDARNKLVSAICTDRETVAACRFFLYERANIT